MIEVRFALRLDLGHRIRYSTDMSQSNEFQHLIQRITGDVVATTVLIAAVTKCILTVIAGWKKVAAAVPSKNAVSGILST